MAHLRIRKSYNVCYVEYKGQDDDRNKSDEHEDKADREDSAELTGDSISPRTL
jgi:hypothetical protein